MSQQLPEEWLISDGRINAAITWILSVLLLVLAAFFLIIGAFIDSAIAAAVAIVAVVPAMEATSYQRTAPWPLVLVAALPTVVTVARPTFASQFLDGIGIAALAMLVVVALQLTTSVRMTPLFAVVFVVLTTMAAAGFWAVVSYFSAQWLGTPFLETNTELMYVFIAATVAGVVAGLLFRWYFRRRLAADVRAARPEVKVP